MPTARGPSASISTNCYRRGTMNLTKLWGALLVAAAVAMPVAAQETTLRGVSAFPKGMSLTGDFQRYIDLVNRDGKGVVQIRLIGGPEVTPPAEQGAALARGVFD